MRIVLTGATSKVGRFLLERLLERPEVEKVLCIGRSLEKLSKIVSHLSDNQIERVEVYEQDLNSDFTSLENRLENGKPLDWIVHLAAVTHSAEEENYFLTNYEATVRLAMWAQRQRCNKFCFISSQTAGLGAGEYALSKFMAEKTLLVMNWQQLIIFRPSEVMGLGGKEGLEKFEEMARRFKIYPLLLDSKWRPVVFHPLGVEELLTDIIGNIFKAESEMSLSVEPQRFAGTIRNLHGDRQTALDFAKKAWHDKMAIPIPIYVPLLGFLFGVLSAVKSGLVVQDQVPRLLGVRGQNPAPGLVHVQDILLPRSNLPIS